MSSYGDRDDEQGPLRRVRGGPRKALLVRLAPELHEELRRWAAQEFRSLNAHIEYLLAESVRQRRGPRERDRP